MKKTHFIIFFVMIIVCISSLTACSLYSYENHDEAVEYLKKYDQNNNIYYVDSTYIHLNENELEYEDFMGGYWPLYLTKDNIYFLRGNIVYVTDYEFSNTRKICEFEHESKSYNISMYNEYEIRFREGDVKKIYHLNESRMETVDDFTPLDKKYIIEENGNSYTITLKESNETKLVDMSENSKIFDIEQANYLRNEIEFEVYVVKEVNGKIYFDCVSGFIVTTYLYDFETDTFTFLDWSECYGSFKSFILY